MFTRPIYYEIAFHLADLIFLLSLNFSLRVSLLSMVAIFIVKDA